jgi:HK97 family phage major capsid protein
VASLTSLERQRNFRARARREAELLENPEEQQKALVNSIARAAIVTGARVFDGAVPRTANDLLRERSWTADRTASLLTRAASTPAMLSQAGWAAELGQVAIALLRSLVPMSAAAALLDQCLTLSFNGAAKISLPNITPGTATWVADGAPIRVLTMPTLVSQSLLPSKLATIVELTREMMESSNIEAIVRQALIDASATSLDKFLFDAQPAVPDLRPPGILNGVTPLTASAATNKLEAMCDDIAALVGAIAPYAGNGSVAFVMAPPQATRVALLAETSPGQVLMSSALAAGTAIAVATNSLVSALEPVRIDAAKSAVLHREDTNPQPPPAGPSSSLFQTDCAALRLRLPVTWAMRDTRAVAVVNSTKW